MRPTGYSLKRHFIEDKNGDRKLNLDDWNSLQEKCVLFYAALMNLGEVLRNEPKTTAKVIDICNKLELKTKLLFSALQDDCHKTLSDNKERFIIFKFEKTNKSLNTAKDASDNEENSFEKIKSAYIEFRVLWDRLHINMRDMHFPTSQKPSRCHKRLEEIIGRLRFQLEDDYSSCEFDDCVWRRKRSN
jgi:hypothetical protein